MNSFVRVSFGSRYILRPVAPQRDIEAEVQVFSRVFGQPSNMGHGTTPISHSRAAMTPTNAKLNIHYRTQNKDHVWRELHERLATQTRVFGVLELYSVFGNITYTQDDRSLQCTGVRDLSHVAAISRIVRDESSGDKPLCIDISRYTLSGSIGHSMQIVPGCMLESMLQTLFGSVVRIGARTEEDMNAVHFSIESLHAFLNKAMDLALLQRTPALIEPDCRVFVQLTHRGAIFIRYLWTTPSLVRDMHQIDETKDALRKTSDTIADAIRQIC